MLIIYHVIVPASSNLTIIIINPTVLKQHPPKLFLADLPGKINIYSLKADYTHPFSENTSLETGVKTSYVNTHNNAQYYDGVNNKWIKNDSQSDHFLYKENINAAYLNLLHKLSQWEFQVGLRAAKTCSFSPLLSWSMMWISKVKCHCPTGAG